MAEAARRRTAPRELAVAALVGAASLPLARLFEPGGLGAVVVLTVVVALSVNWFGRRLRLPPLAAWLFSLVTLVWFLAVRFFPETLFGVFPSPESFMALSGAARDGAQQIYNEATPAPPTPELLLFVAAGVWLTVWLVDTASIWLGNPLLAAASGVPLFVFAGALEPSRRLWVEATLYLVAAAWVLFDDERERLQRWAPVSARERPGWRMGAAASAAVIAALVAATLTPRLPGFGAPPKLSEGLGGTRIAFNPFVSVKPALDIDPPRPLFRVRTSQLGYFRLDSLAFFDGEVFSGDRRPETTVAGSTISGTTSADVREVEQFIRVMNLGGQWVPAMYEPRGIMSNAEVMYSASSQALLVPNGLRRGMGFRVVSAIPQVSASDLDEKVTYGSEMDEYLQLPRGTPREIFRIARDVAGSEPTQFRQAVKLQRYLRTFRYNERVALKHDFDDLVEFLTEVREGYCEQFAAAMAVLARALGIPSRVAIGFGLGDETEERNEYIVTSDEAHAWTELYFPQVGWIAWEPTPRGAGITQTPLYTRTIPGVADEPEVDPSPGTASPQPTAAPTTGTSPNETSEPEGTSADATPSWLPPVVALGMLAVLVIGMALTPVLVRRRRLRRARHARDAVRVRYVDFLEWCASAGVPRIAAETPAEHARRLSEIAPEARAPLGTLTRAVEQALWAPSDGLDPDEAGEAAARARAAVRETLPRPHRVLAALGWRRWEAQ